MRMKIYKGFEKISGDMGFPSIDSPRHYMDKYQSAGSPPLPCNGLRKRISDRELDNAETVVSDPFSMIPAQFKARQLNEK
jgi:hypothetical protein